MVEQAGSLAGFAAVVGLAILSALYFSQARDLRRLREWAGRAPERAAEGQPSTVVPGRVTAVPQQPRPATPPAPATPAAGAAPANGEKAKEGEDADKQEQPAGAASNGDAAPSVAAADGKEASEAEGDGDKPGAKPGMPAPASAAAAAAGAGAKSVAGPAAPGSAPAPAGTPSASAPAAAPGAPAVAPGSGGGKPDSDGGGDSGDAAKPAAPAPASPGTPGRPATPAATPQRPPGSVLPPRTGTLPPVRRLPSSNVGPAQTGVLGQAQQPQKKKRNPVYVVLAVAGVLVLGAAAAVGVPALVNGSKDDKSPSKTAKKTKTTTAKKTAAPPVAPDKITVAVLNGTPIPGLAAQVGDRVDAEGFTVGTISNASQTQGARANSVAMYAPGHRSDAKRVADRLGIHNVTKVDADTQQIAGDASVVVIVGSDKTQ